MDYSQVFSDPELEEEFLDKFSDLADKAPKVSGGLESAEVSDLDVDRARESIDEMKGGDYSGGDTGLEAIIERFTRPVYLVQDSTFNEPGDEFDNSENVKERLEAATGVLESVIPSVGRVEVRNHRLDWVGTGWVLAEDVVATNRHVAEEFARASNGGFSFRINSMGSTMGVTMDWRREHQRSAESRFRVTEVIWIEPDGSPDVALLRVVNTGEAGESQPTPIVLSEEGDITIGKWVGVIGYPAQDSRNSLTDQQRIFDGIYNVKRLSPGKLTAVGGGLVEHDATTLGGSSGSAVIDFETGNAMAIHFGGLEGAENRAVRASELADIVRQHAGGNSYQ